MNCSQVAMFQIMPAFCPHGQGEGGPKNSQICADILYGWPHTKKRIVLQSIGKQDNAF